MNLGVKFGLALVMSIFLISFAFAVVPFGVENIVVENTSTSMVDSAQSVQAQAGNVTELNIFGYSVTQSWQGYFGNVSGTIQLADSSDNIMYNWSLADPEGEIYASVNSSINWAGTSCWDMNSNINILESAYNIASDDVDGIDETFNWATHSEFYVNNIHIAANSCNSTRIFDSTGQGTANNYEEVILEGGSGEIIWTAIIEEGAVNGFDGRNHDFQMLVPEDGHGTDLDTTPYYFYVELQ